MNEMVRRIKMKKKLYVLLYMILILLFCTSCRKSFSESDYNFNNAALIYNYESIPKDFWNSLYPKDPNSFERDYFELRHDAKISNFEHFAYSLVGFAGETYVDKHNLNVSNLDYTNYQDDYSFNSFRDQAIDVCVEVHPGDWTFSGHGNETYPIVYYFDSEMEYHPVYIERIDDILGNEISSKTFSKLEYVNTYNDWQVYIRPNSIPNGYPYAIHLFQQLGKDAIFMIKVDLPYISDDKTFDLNDFYNRLSKLVTLSSEQKYERLPFEMPNFQKTDEIEDEEIVEEIEEIVEPIEEETQNLTIRKDYIEDTISTDEYVRYSLQALFNYETLDEKYKQMDIPLEYDINALIEDNIDELSVETIKYYLECISLQGVTFFAEENSKSKDTINLNKLVLSENKRFMVWYTTEGPAAITDDDAKILVDNLENMSLYCESLLNSEYQMTSFWISDSIKSQDKLTQQKSILQKYGFDENYLLNSLNVYVVSPEQYKASGITIQNLSNKLSEKLMLDNKSIFDGVPIVPYMLINNENFVNQDSIKQIASHEIFHYFQNSIVDYDEIVTDRIANEVIAQWASAKYCNAVNGNSFLNNHAGDLRRKSSMPITDIVSYYGKEQLGYMLFPYIQCIENTVENGSSKIIDMMWKEDLFDYLDEITTYEERKIITRKMINYYLNNDTASGMTLYTENDEDMLELPLNRIEEPIERITGKELTPIRMDYYEVIFDNNDYRLTIHVDDENLISNLICYLIAFNHQTQKYEIYDEFLLDYKEQIRKLKKNDFNENNIYVVIANMSHTTYETYSCDFVQEQQVDIKSFSPSDLSSIDSEIEIEAYSYAIAWNIKEQVEEYLNALKTGNIEYLLENNSISSINDDVIEQFVKMTAYDYGSDVVRILYEDITFDISDNMLKKWQKEVKEFYFANNDEEEYQEEEIAQFSMLYTLPDTTNWYRNIPYGIKQEIFIPPSDNGFSNNEVLNTLTDAKTILEYYTKDTILIEMSKNTFNVKINLTSFLEPMNEILLDRGNETYSIDENYPRRIISKLNFDKTYVVNVENAADFPYIYKADEYEYLIQKLINRDFIGLEEFYVSIDLDKNAAYVESLYDKYGKYEELTESQKQFVDNFYNTYYDVKISDYVGTSFDGDSIRDGDVYIVYPYMDVLDLYNMNIYYRMENCIENKFNSVHYFPLESISKNDSDLQNISQFILRDYYILIGYAKKYVE